MLRELFGTSKPQQPAPAQSPKPAAPVIKPDSVLGANTHLEGTLRAEGNVRIDGTFIGDVYTTGRILIGELGKVEGNLIGETVDTAGVVKGNVIARKVSVLRTGRLLGDLRLETLITEEGGFMQGLVTMEETVDISAYLPGKPEPEAAEEKTAEAEAVAEPKAEAAPEKVKVTAKAGKG